MIFAGCLGFLHLLQLASHYLTGFCLKKCKKSKFKFDFVLGDKYFAVWWGFVIYVSCLISLNVYACMYFCKVV